MDNMSNDVDSSALETILGDMDDMESDRVYGDKPTPAEGVSITIDVAPKKGEDPKKEDDHDEAECLAKGGCAKHMSKGGMVDEDESKMPPFLRKRK